ncbi:MULTISPECIES: dUTP diphosphatase [Bacillus]|uniref:dUTP diphosphatase n=1 Tax=Bacillus TaxID=1386 RepID=UPI0002E14D1D|nr:MULTISPECIES: dUTP diphosphatase [Bacillus]
MNLEKMFEAQKKLHDHIGYKGEDKFGKDIAALISEIGECLNEWRGHKYWSNNQESVKYVIVDCSECDGKGVYLDYGDDAFYECSLCNGLGKEGKEKNRVLEEYTDILTIVLEIGLNYEYTNINFCELKNDLWMYQKFDILNTFLLFIKRCNDLIMDEETDEYYWLLFNVIDLGKKLGFSWNEIEQAYYEKNRINHERQENGY